MAILANELRIGNWVKISQRQTTVSHIMGDEDFFEPIHLTPEILDNFGFKKYQWMDGYFIKTKFGDLMVQFYKGRIILFFTNVGFDSIGMKLSGRKYVGNLNSTENIKYAHQLQNLYWCLCGEELTYNP